MKRSFLLIAIIICGVNLKAQQGVIADTSFTIHSAFVKAKKTHPYISIVGDTLPPAVKAARNIVYCRRGDHDLSLDVFYPKRRHKPRPAVLLIHGGGWRSGNRWQQEPMAIDLAANGYVAVTVTYRLSTEAPYPAALHDVKAAIRWIRAYGKTYGIDTGKIAVLGCSAGGQLAALAGTTNGIPNFEDSSCYASSNSRVQAIIDVDGVLAFIHPESGEGDERKGPSAATLWLGGTKEQVPDRWQETSALNHADASTPPILFINSGVARMHAGRDDLMRRLQGFNTYTEVHTFEDAPHPFWLFHPWFRPMMGYIISFLHKVFR